MGDVETIAQDGGLSASEGADTVSQDRQARLYDAACKRLLSRKVILAWVMRAFVPEFAGCPISQIVDCMEGEPKMASPIVSQGDRGASGVSERLEADGMPSLASDARGMSDCSVPVEGTGLIRGLNVEDNRLYAGSVMYDVLLRAVVPRRKKDGAAGTDDGLQAIDLLVNVEAQDDFYPGYPLVTRAQYYCARLLATQQGVEFDKSHYERLKKVYSIWICTDPPYCRRGTVNCYGMSETTYPSTAPGWPQRTYDLMRVIMLYLGAPDTGESAGMTGALNLLTLLFTSNASAEEKLDIMRERYNISSDEGIESEVRTMGGFARGLMTTCMEKGMEKGRGQGILLSIRRLAKNMGWPFERAMDALGIPEEERAGYMRRLAEGERGDGATAYSKANG